jgi:hypothetical protein
MPLAGLVPLERPDAASTSDEDEELNARPVRLPPTDAGIAGATVTPPGAVNAV